VVVFESQHLSTSGEFRRGWRFVLGAALGAGFGLNGLPFYTLGLFLKPIAAEFGWTRGQISGAALCLMAGTAVGGPIVGLFADRVDVRRIGLISMCGLALGYLGMSRIGGDLGAFYGALLGLAMAACGTAPIVWTRIVNGWFDSGRGLALALTLAGTGLAAIGGPLFVAAIARDHGWRGAYVGLAAATAILAVLPVGWLLRGAEAGRGGRVLGAGLQGLLLDEAIRTRAFWSIIVAFFFVSTCIGGGIVHLAPLLTDAGAPAGLAARLAGLMGVAVLTGRLIVGALLDRYPARYVAAAFLSPPIAGCLMLANAGGSIAIDAVAALALGLAAGAEVDLIAYLTSRYFGLKAYGRIYSLQLVPFAIGAGVGPFAAGGVYDAFGAYRPALYGGAAMLALAVALLQALGPYRFARSDRAVPAGRPAN
jgi:MFS family permease